MILKGKTVKKGIVEGEAIVSQLPFSFLGDLDPLTGKVVPEGHDLQGHSIAGKIFVFETGKGSTVGPNVAFQAKQLGNTPAGMICVEVEPVMAMVSHGFLSSLCTIGISVIIATISMTRS